LLFSTFTDRVDIWALGCVLYKLVCGNNIFQEDWHVVTYAREGQKLSVSVLPFVDANARTPLKNIIREMLRLRPNRRPSAADLRSLFDGIDGSFLYHGAIDCPLYPRICTLSKSIVFSVPPYGRNEYFSGRDDVLETLFRELNDRSTNHYTRRITLHGLPGIGKTQIALEYAYEHRDDYAYVFWISGADRARLLSGFGEIASRTVGCHLSERPEDVAKRVLQWLQETEDWLLIIDNLDNMTVVDACLPDSENGHTIITTRSPNICGIPSISLPVVEMSHENSIKFLLLRLGNPEATENVREGAAQIVDALHRLPLAIDHAGAYIWRTKNVFEYLANFHACRQESLLDLTVSSIHNRTVATTWKLSFARLSPAAAKLLEYLAFMNPDEIVIDYLRAGATVLPLTLQTALKDPAQWRGLVQSLEVLWNCRFAGFGTRVCI